MSGNPYNMTIPGNLFVGYEDTRQELLMGLRDGNSHAIIGGRRIGKTSLLLKINEDIGNEGLEPFTPLPRFLDIHALYTLTPASLFETIYLLVVQDIEEAPSWMPGKASRDYENFLHHLDVAQPLLEKYYGSNWLVILLIDELDTAATGLADDFFFRYLRNFLMVSRYRRHYRLVASGTNRMTDLIRFGSPLNFLRNLSLGILTDQQARQLIAYGFPKGLGPEVESLLLQRTGRHPYLLQALLERLWGWGNTVDIKAIRNAERGFLHQHDDFRHWMNAFGLAEHVVYQLLFEASEGALHVRELRQGIAPELHLNIDEALIVLSCHGVIDGTDMDVPKITGTLFRDWYWNNSSRHEPQLEQEKASRPLSLYISYSHTDRRLRNAFDTHLSSFKRQGLITSWYDAEIIPGEAKENRINLTLEDADIILLLISSHFLSSEYCNNIEMKRIIERYEANEIFVIPIIIRPTDLQGTPFENLQVLPRDAGPVTTWKNRDDAWFDVMQSIRLTISSLAAKDSDRRRIAQQAWITFAEQEFSQIDTFERIADAAQILKFIPSNARYLLRGLYDVRTYVDTISQKSQDYLVLTTIPGKIRILEELKKNLRVFRDTMIFVEPPVGSSFQNLATHWIQIVEKEEQHLQERLSFTPIPNPYIVGNPLHLRDENLFKGRKDIIVAIEENIINPNQSPALLLYGRRRIGKTSTLLQLPHILSSQLIPVFIDCQDAKWREGDAVFCYYLIYTIFTELQKRHKLTGLGEIYLEQFEKYPFAMLANSLDSLEHILSSMRKKILLTFDEYEKLGEGIHDAKITIELLNQIRHIIQHREYIAMLFSGSHRFEEMQIVNWSDYLINVKMLELSFLSNKDAYELITQPVPNLQYEPGVAESMITFTHRQPYLLQAMASELVNYLNAQERFIAQTGDIEVVINKVLVTAHAYFFFTWQEECSEEEREVLRSIAVNEAKELDLTQHREALQNLCRKEVLQRTDHNYQFTIELFRRWLVRTQTLDESLEVISRSGN